LQSLEFLINRQLFGASVGLFRLFRLLFAKGRYQIGAILTKTFG